jgi:hypothetical protein
VKQVFILGLEAKKSISVNDLNVWKPLVGMVGSISQQSEDQGLQSGLECDNFKPRLQSGVYKSISRLNDLFFFGVMMKEGVNTYGIYGQLGTNFAS